MYLDINLLYLIIFIYFILISIYIVLILERRKILFEIKDKINTNNELVGKNNTYHNIRIIDPGFVVYNSTYRQIPVNWNGTVYVSEQYAINGWATCSLDPESWKGSLFESGDNIMCSSYNRYALYCKMSKSTENGPMLILEDPFGVIISNPIPNITNEEAAQLVGRILFLTMTIFPKLNRCTISSIRRTNLELYRNTKTRIPYLIKVDKSYINLNEYYTKHLE